MMNKLYLGDPVFTKKMMKLYGWLLPSVFFLLSGLMLAAGAWLTAVCFSAAALLALPPLKNFYCKAKLNSMLRFILAVLLILSAIYSTGVYLS